ncbi:MAG: hypothetical protein A2189_07425 [Paenibacillus sp. RIFOXYA1_FULL_44_5]|nr:MAG: hypothetical protein A2189_07425 [Paenibacillus sp. RIFOXYA1_FULL_44_5]
MEQKWPEQAVITQVEKQKYQHQYKIFLDEQHAFSVDEDILIKHKLIKGKTITRQEIEEILADETLHHVYTDALQILSRRVHAQKELRQKLQKKGYHQQNIDAVIEQLLKQNLLDDREFAEMWSQNRLHSQKKGRNWIRQELQQKGVSRELVQETIEKIDADAEQQAAMELGRKKWQLLKEPDMRQKMQKTAGYLLRRGYSQDMVSHVIHSLRDMEKKP